MGALATLGRAIGLNVGFDKETKPASPPPPTAGGITVAGNALKDGKTSTDEQLKKIKGYARGGIIGKGVPAKPKMEGIGAGVPGFSGAGVPGKKFGKCK